MKQLAKSKLIILFVCILIAGHVFLNKYRVEHLTELRNNDYLKDPDVVDADKNYKYYLGKEGANAKNTIDAKKRLDDVTAQFKMFYVVRQFEGDLGDEKKKREDAESKLKLAEAERDSAQSNWDAEKTSRNASDMMARSLNDSYTRLLMAFIVCVLIIGIGLIVWLYRRFTSPTQ